MNEDHAADWPAEDPGWNEMPDDADLRRHGESVHMRDGFHPNTGDTIEAETVELLPSLDLVAWSQVRAQAKEFIIRSLPPLVR